MPSAPAGFERFARPTPGDAQIESLRLPPHSVEAEQAVLGGLLLSNQSWDRIGDVTLAIVEKVGDKVTLQALMVDRK